MSDISTTIQLEKKTKNSMGVGKIFFQIFARKKKMKC